MIAYDVIVIGLGTAGAAACMALARRGLSVLGLDAYRPPHCLGSHHGESRSVRRAYLEGTAYVPMAQKAWELWRRLEKESGERLLSTTGNLTIGPPEGPAVSGFMASARRAGIPHDVLTAVEIRRRWPQLTPDDHFLLGPLPENEHVFSVALAGHGFKFAPLLGEILADMIEGLPPAFDLDFFSPHRFVRRS